MNRIKDLRQAHGWTQPQLGKRIGAARSTISMYESELRQLDVPTIHALCDLFGCTADYLLGRSETPLPAISDEDARILAAFHAADARDQDYIRHLLRLDDATGKDYLQVGNDDNKKVETATAAS